MDSDNDVDYVEIVAEIRDEIKDTAVCMRFLLDTVKELYARNEELEKENKKLHETILQMSKR